MKFKYVLSLLNNKIHPIPDEHREEVELVKKILTEGKGYLRKSNPIRIIFFENDDYAR